MKLTSLTTFRISQRTRIGRIEGHERLHLTVSSTTVDWTIDILQSGGVLEIVANRWLLHAVKQ